jgi:hypothetical protein
VQLVDFGILRPKAGTDEQTAGQNWSQRQSSDRFHFSSALVSPQYKNSALKRKLLFRQNIFLFLKSP